MWRKLFIARRLRFSESFFAYQKNRNWSVRTEIQTIFENKSSGRLNEHIADVDEQASKLFLSIVNQLTNQKKRTKNLKQKTVWWVSEDELHPRSSNPNCKYRRNFGIK